MCICSGMAVVAWSITHGKRGSHYHDAADDPGISAPIPNHSHWRDVLMLMASKSGRDDAVSLDGWKGLNRDSAG